MSLIRKRGGRRGRRGRKGREEREGGEGILNSLHKQLLIRRIGYTELVN